MMVTKRWAFLIVAVASQVMAWTGLLFGLPSAFQWASASVCLGCLVAAIICTHLNDIRAEETWLENNPEAKASVMRGIEQAKRGELVDVNVEAISRPEICTAEECLAFDRLVVYRDKKLSPMTISEGDRDRLISMILKLRQAYDEATGKNYTTKRTDTQSPENEGVR